MAIAVLRARPPVVPRLLYRAMSTHLADAHCVPCSKKAIRELGLQRLGDAEAAAKLQELEPGWALQPQPTVQASPAPELPPALHKVYRFRNFTTAAAFTQAVGAEAEAEGHHPALLLEWGSVAVWWWSHALQGVRASTHSSSMTTTISWRPAPTDWPPRPKGGANAGPGSGGLRLAMTRAVPLWQRPVDAFYFAFFALHLCARSRAGVFSAVGVSSRFGTYVACAEASDYLEQSADPLLPHAWEPRYAWMRMALFSEFVLQVPAFVLGLYALWKGACTILTADDRRLYPVLIAYGAIACFTTIQCIAMVTIGEERLQLSSAQLQFILQNYVPFMLIPGLLCIDMVVRTARLLPAPRTAHIKST